MLGAQLGQLIARIIKRSCQLLNVLSDFRIAERVNRAPAVRIAAKHVLSDERFVRHNAAFQFETLTPINT